MARKDIIRMSGKELNRIKTIHSVLEQGRYKGFGPTQPGKPEEMAHKQWRERKQHYGEMVQVDGSEHDWLEGRGPKLVHRRYHR